MPILHVGDQIQLIVTKDGVPYAKTLVVNVANDVSSSYTISRDILPMMMYSLVQDIRLYGDEHEERVEVSEEGSQGHV